MTTDMYFVRGKDQKEYGPVDATTVRQWIAENRLNAASPIRATTHTDWQSLSAMPEFRPLVVAGTHTVPPPLSKGVAAKPRSGSKTSALAVTSLVLGLTGLCTMGTTALVGLIISIVALIAIKRSRGTLQGNGFAVAGLCVSAFVILAAAVVLALSVTRVVRHQQFNQRAPQNHFQRNACVNNLRQIDGAKEQWAIAKGKQPADVPTWDDLVGPDKYLPEQPKCPDGGTYTIGSVMELPSCSIPDHSMKQNYRYRGNR